jgi:uncharacterized membrane protein YgcG
MRLFTHSYKRACGLLLLGLLGALQVSLAEERILSFDSTITVNRDGSLEVHEAIRVRAEGQNIRRGIYRDFPTVYPRADGSKTVVAFNFQSAKRDGNDEPWRAENRGNGVRVYLGSPSRTLSHGEHTYELIYRTDRQMGYFDDHDELYWNATGNGWGFVIERATARVLLPDEIPRADIKLEAYTGPQGARGQAFTSRLDNGAPLFGTTQPLNPGEGLSIVAMWPKGFIMPPVEGEQPPMQDTSASVDQGYAMESQNLPRYDSPAEKFLERELPRDNRPFFFGLLGLGLLIAYYYFIWDKVGRDPPGRVVIPEYEMPTRQSAASMRYLLHMSYDNECFAAGILSLAVKGHLLIEQSSGILGFGRKFTLRRATTAGGKPLTQDEQALLAELFEDGDTLELEKENHRRVNDVREEHEAAVEANYKAGFFSVNGGWHFLGILLSLVIFAVTLSQPGAAYFWPQWYLTSPLGWLTVATAIAALVANGVFGKLLKAPTVAGQKAMDHIRGFRMYLEVAEGEELKRISTPPPKLTPELYQAYLPAALALDVEQKWAERFARELEIEPERYQPAWYSGPAWNAASLGSFSSEVGSSLSQAISSASQAPGSSSGGGGGGSSGGGGGGGGGGGW